jgi:hypothetical protein
VFRPFSNNLPRGQLLVTRSFARASVRRMGAKIAAVAALTSPLISCESDGTDPRLQSADAREPSVARLWNETMLQAIRDDLARPTVQARNLFHVSAAMYDAWALYSETASPYLAGTQYAAFGCSLDGFRARGDRHAAREEAISYAAYRIIRHRFRNSPGAATTLPALDALMTTLGYDPADAVTDLSGGSAAAVGNRIAECYIGYGLQDGANEGDGYRNRFYRPVNPPIEPFKYGNSTIVDLDRWQPISLPLAIDQSGNVIPSTPPALSPEWGAVAPFALNVADRKTHFRDGFEYNVYYDPGPPPKVHGTFADLYKWNYALVAVWSGHLDPADRVLIDISPASLGNTQLLPATFDEYDDFYDLLNGGVRQNGHAINPATGAPYVPQIVPRGDYTRALAEFWADGPTSETPPGHWYAILNAVNDHPLLERRLGGAGHELGPLEWDIKSYFALGGAMHDVAIAAWGIKGWYDSVRPVSAIRAMADRGQSSNPNAASYHPDGLPLVPGHIELIGPGDPLAGPANENVGKLKIYAWRGPAVIADPKTEQAHVDWILGSQWWPYQRPTFVTPPFPGYISGHSTYSRAGAEVLTAITGDAYFPGGMSQFEIKANVSLIHEKGPSVDVTFQWATYRDAAEQSSLSRIWGGIHPPVDDIPGRVIGAQIGQAAYRLASDYFDRR